MLGDAAEMPSGVPSAGVGARTDRERDGRQARGTGERRPRVGELIARWVPSAMSDSGESSASVSYGGCVCFRVWSAGWGVAMGRRARVPAPRLSYDNIDRHKCAEG